MPVGKRKISNTPAATASRERARAFRDKGLCRCGRLLGVSSTSRCESCTTSDKETLRRVREIVIRHYGGKCACCGVSEYEFLSIDHVEGNGNQHRLQVTGNKKSLPCRWFIQNNFPSGFQILCHNCNMAKGIYGACPHQRGN